MMDFLEGGNWQRRRQSDFRIDVMSEIESLIDYKIDYNQVPDIEGLPDRWVKIIEMNTRDIRLLWMGGLWSENHEPEVHCVKEGLWVW